MKTLALDGKMFDVVCSQTREPFMSLKATYFIDQSVHRILQNLLNLSIRSISSDFFIFPGGLRTISQVLGFRKKGKRSILGVQVSQRYNLV